MRYQQMEMNRMEERCVSKLFQNQSLPFAKIFHASKLFQNQSFTVAKIFHVSYAYRYVRSVFHFFKPALSNFLRDS